MQSVPREDSGGAPSAQIQLETPLSARVAPSISECCAVYPAGNPLGPALREYSSSAWPPYGSIGHVAGRPRAIDGAGMYDVPGTRNQREQPSLRLPLATGVGA